MDLSSIELPVFWSAAAMGMMLPLLVWAIWRTRSTVEKNGATTNAWHGGIATCVVLWSLQATVSGYFTFHLLGMAGLTLALGAPLALVSSAVVVVVHLLIHGGAWQNFAVVWLTLCTVPIAVSALTLRVTERFLAPNFFIYIFVVAFFGTALSLVVAGLVSMLVFCIATDASLANTLSNYAPYLLQLGFGEAMLTGMIVTIGVVYRPQWVATFDDRRYLTPR
jgi:uncharacterized membrane protein